MNEEVKDILLNGMPVARFLAYYGASLLGALIWFLIKTLKGISLDKTTPYNFKWAYFWRGLLKFAVTVLILPWAVIYFPDYAPFILETLFKFPQFDEGIKMEIGMNAGSAALIGFFIDAGIRKLTHTTFKKFMK